MKKLILITITVFLFVACSDNELLPETQPEIQPNFIHYLKGKNSDSVFTLSQYTKIEYKVVYNINENEISSNGFQVSEIVGTKINQKYWTVSYKKDLTKRADTLRYQTNLWEYAKPGDSAYFIVNLSRKNSETTYSKLAADTIIFMVVK